MEACHKRQFLRRDFYVNWIEIMWGKGRLGVVWWDEIRRTENKVKWSEIIQWSRMKWSEVRWNIWGKWRKNLKHYQGNQGNNSHQRTPSLENRPQDFQSTSVHRPKNPRVFIVFLLILERLARRCIEFITSRSSGLESGKHESCRFNGITGSHNVWVWVGDIGAWVGVLEGCGEWVERPGCDMNLLSKEDCVALRNGFTCSQHITFSKMMTRLG